MKNNKKFYVVIKFMKNSNYKSLEFKMEKPAKKDGHVTVFNNFEEAVKYFNSVDLKAIPKAKY